MTYYVNGFVLNFRSNTSALFAKKQTNKHKCKRVHECNAGMLLTWEQTLLHEHALEINILLVKYANIYLFIFAQRKGFFPFFW